MLVKLFKLSFILYQIVSNTHVNCKIYNVFRVKLNYIIDYVNINYFY